jgi:hypothetical protein
VETLIGNQAPVDGIGQPVLEPFRARVWRPAVAAAGLGGLRIHDLRHTAVALWIAAGAGPKEVAARAGHTSVSLTLHRYGHLYPEADVALRDRLDELFVPATEHRLPRNATRAPEPDGPCARPAVMVGWR